jgi:ABC-2 type transport system permease protein
VRLDWEIAKRGWRRYAAYPWATAAGVFTNTIFGFLQAYILLAVFRHRARVGNYDASDVVTYVWLAQALIMTVFIFGWTDLSLRIRDGSIATDLARPLDPLRYWLAFDLGRAPYHFIFRGLLPFAIGALVFQLHYPTAVHAVAFGLSVTLAVIVSLGYRFLYNAAAFWILDIRGVMLVAMTLSIFFSGMAIPLALFPNWLRDIAHVLPFASLMQTPIDIWLGKYHGPALIGALALQVLWALVFLGLGRLALRGGTKKLVIQGG